jgi:hypothetical protein
MDNPRVPANKKEFPEISANSLENELTNMVLDELIPMLEGYYKKGVHTLVKKVAKAVGLIVGSDGKIRKPQ